MKTVLRSEKAPKAIGPYSQAILAGGFLFISGQLPINAKTGLMAKHIAEQTKDSLQNIVGIVEGAGLSAKDIVKTTLYVQDLSHFPLINEVYSTFFSVDPPARSCVEVSRLPKDALIEIEAIARIGEGTES
jgi:2-iminobutanoate/2-iminopropanoate deaminase